MNSIHHDGMGGGPGELIEVEKESGPAGVEHHFAELKRSLRERPQLRGFGVEPGRVGVQEDWYAGRRDAPR